MTKRMAVVLGIFMCSVFCFISFGFASLSDKIDVSGSMYAEPPDTIIITEVTTLTDVTTASETHSRVNPTNVQSTINGTKGQSIVYRIKTHNYSKTETYVYNGLRYHETYVDTLNKLTISVSLDEGGADLLPTTPEALSVSGTPVAPGEDFVFYATYTLTEDVTAEEILLNYSFDTVRYSVTYLDNNEVWAIDCIINNSEIYYVRDEGPDLPAGDNRVFSDWVNANAAPVDSYPAGNTHDYTLSAKWDNLYLIMFVDKDGNILYQETFPSSASALSASGQQTVANLLAQMNREAAADDMTVAWSDYSIQGAKADIVVRPIYTYIGTLRFTPVDRDGDGIIDYYQVDAVSKLSDPVKVPGMHQGLPVEVVNKLYKNEDNFDYGAGIKTIHIEEGILRLERNSLAYTADLQNVYLPNSLEYIGKNAFSRNWSNDKKVITIHYNGTMAEWKEVVANSHEDWDNGITTKDGSRVMCSDGYFEYDHGFLGIGAKWVENKY